MFLQLMKIRLLSAKNTALDTARRHPILSVGLTVLSVALFVGMYVGFLVFFAFSQRLAVLSETIYQVFYFLFLFLLAGAVPFVASTLLHSADYTLLFSAPVPPRTVIAAKLLDATITNSLQFTVLGIPAIVASASAAGISLLGWLLVPVLVILFVLLPALITALGLLILLSIVGMRQLRAAISLLNGLMAFVVCVTIVLEVGQLPIKPGDLARPMESLHPSLTATSSTAHLAPSHWFAEALLGLVSGSQGNLMQTLLSLGKIGLVVGVLYVLCMGLGARLLSAASVTEENEGGSVSTSGDEARLWRTLFPAPIAALLVKDFKYLWRDSVLLSQLTMPLILFFVPFLLAFQDNSLRGREEIFPFALGMVGVILFMQCSILSLSSIGLESRGFWVMLASPTRGSTLLWAKFLLSSLVCAGMGGVLMVLSCLAFNIPVPQAVLLVGVVLLMTTGLCGLGVGISATFPRFVYENPAHRVSAWALILGFFASVGYLAVGGTAFGLAWLLGMQSGDSALTQRLFLIATLLFAVLTLVAVVVPIAIGARRIERYAWEH